MNDTALRDARASTKNLADLLRQEHSSLADFLVALAEFDARESWRCLGHASVFDFLHRELGLSRAAAHYRKVAARLVRRFPEIVGPLRNGKLCITSVIELARVMTEENRAEVLPRFFHCSKREARAVAVEISPVGVVPRRTVVTLARPGEGLPSEVVASSIDGSHRDDGRNCEGDHRSTGDDDRHATGRPNGSRSEGNGRAAGVSAAGTGQDGGTEGAGGGTGNGPDASTDADAGAGAGAGAGVHPGELPMTHQPRGKDSAEPLTAYLRRLHITVSRRFVDKLDRATAGQSHVQPGATAEQVLEAALDLLLAAQSKRRSVVPPKVKREVRRRDGGRCQWRLDSGEICGSIVRTEIDHVVPRGRGGPSTVANCRVLCSVHNKEAARQVYGEAWMNQYAPRRGKRRIGGDGTTDASAVSEAKEPVARYGRRSCERPRGHRAWGLPRPDG